MLELKVETNVEQLRTALRILAGRTRAGGQVAFAGAKALTITAAKVADAERDDMGHRFKLRSKRPVRGIQSTRASKKDWPNASALVGTRDEFIADHIIGRTRRTRGAFQAIPTKIVTRKRTSGGKIPRPYQPKTLRSRRHIYSERERSLRLTARGAKILTKRARGLRIMFLLRRRVRIRSRWPFAEVAERAIGKHYRPVFERALRDALRTARPRSPRLRP